MGRMKQFVTFFAVVAGVVTASAQMVVRGTVRDDIGEPMAESEVYVNGYPGNSTVTDEKGNYQLTVPANQAQNGKFKIVSTTIGLPDVTREVPYQEGGTLEDISFAMVDPSSATPAKGTQVAGTGVAQIAPTQEVRIVAQRGYGSVAEGESTSSVALVSSKDFNKSVTSPQDMAQGKVAGVVITNTGGAPGAGAKINIRGVGSLSQDTNPLIVIDGIPVDSKSVGGVQNFLSTISAGDIETMSILKDASAKAIYGAQAANGVIIIQTKKGTKGKFKFDLSTYAGLQDPYRTLDVLNAKQFANEVISSANLTQIAKLGTADTNWQDEIFKQALVHNTDFSARGTVVGVPVRLSLGYLGQDGILKTDNFKRLTSSVALSPRFFDNHLSVDLNGMFTFTDSRFADTGAIGNAVGYDPTKPVRNPNGSYYNWLDSGGNYLANLAPSNPVMLLEEQSNTAEARRFLGNAKIDYKLHFFPDLVATVKLGIDRSNSHGRKTPTDEFVYGSKEQTGFHNRYEENRLNKLFEIYGTYNKSIGDNHKIEVLAGHSYQQFRGFGNFRNVTFRTNGNIIDEDTNIDVAVLESFFSRLDYGYKGKYLLTASFRADGSSKVAKENRWGYYPAVSAGWVLNKEKFLENFTKLSLLKLRAGYGQVGNLNNGLGSYIPYLSYGRTENNGAYYQFGTLRPDQNPEFLQSYRPGAYNPNLRWEFSSEWNAGLDYGFFKNRINGSIDVYYKKTTDLIARVNVDPLTNFANQIDANAGDMLNRGVELSLNVLPIKNEKVQWNINYNIAYNQNEITNYPGFNEVGGIAGGTGNNIQIQSKGEEANAFYLLEQVYDKHGRPVEGQFVDRNGDGQITLADRYIAEGPAPSITMGLSTSLNIGNWDFSASSRANLGNYVYDNIYSNRAHQSQIFPVYGLGNVPTRYLDNRFANTSETKLRSDYFYKDASFFRLDNVTLGYRIKSAQDSGIGIRVYGTVQNVLTVTNYDGLDPEIDGGIDNVIYPRPRTYLFGLNINF